MIRIDLRHQCRCRGAQGVHGTRAALQFITQARVAGDQVDRAEFEAAAFELEVPVVLQVGLFHLMHQRPEAFDRLHGSRRQRYALLQTCKLLLHRGPSLRVQPQVPFDLPGQQFVMQGAPRLCHADSEK